MTPLRHQRDRQAVKRRLIADALRGLDMAPLLIAMESELAPHRVVRLADKLAGSVLPGEAVPTAPTPPLGRSALARPAVPRGGRASSLGRG